MHDDFIHVHMAVIFDTRWLKGTAVFGFACHDSARDFDLVYNRIGSHQVFSCVCERLECGMQSRHATALSVGTIASSGSFFDSCSSFISLGTALSLQAVELEIWGCWGWSCDWV